MRSILRSIRDLISGTDATRLQNILMRIPDKVCAAAFPTLSDALQDRLYTLMGATKAARVREEIRIEARRRTSAAVRATTKRSIPKKTLTHFIQAPAFGNRAPADVPMMSKGTPMPSARANKADPPSQTSLVRLI